ncbi:MAG: histidinol-phosphatase [Bacteroidetes bacterium]|jgi:imidazoleglycerol-phosphate dehydratase/histidinol-phosphatase|nr:histidinol-phosphatase [Bacteroidota bacterium]
MAKKILFLDRDGTIIREPDDFCVNRLDKISFLPGVIGSLARLCAAGYELVLVTNQDGLGTEAFPYSDFEGPNQFMLDILASEGVSFLEICVDGHYAHEQHPNRKPGTGMILPLLKKYEVDLASSWVVGDRKTDAKLAENLGCASITIKDPASKDGDVGLADMPQHPTWQVRSWAEIVARLLPAGH